MANYKQFEQTETALIEQNIYDNGELTSYEATYRSNGIEKTACLYFYTDNKTGQRFYSLGFVENLEGQPVTIVASDLAEIFKYKTANTRRKHILNLIRENEALILEQELIELNEILEATEKPLKRVWYNGIVEIVKSGKLKKFYQENDRGFMSSRAYILTTDNELLLASHDVNDVNTSYLIAGLYKEFSAIRQRFVEFYRDQLK